MANENLNSIEQDNILKILESLTARVKELATKILNIRTSFQPTFYEVLTTGATDIELNTHSAVKITPNANATYTTSVPRSGVMVTLMILTSGTSSYTITFGTGFKSTGTLATGVTSARVFVLKFISDGTNLYEVSRTVAMVA